MQKAYDSVEWIYIEKIVEEVEFLRRFIDWILEGVKTFNYTILISGKPIEPFNAARGLRQGDLMSPFPFALATEYLSRKLNKPKK